MSICISRETEALNLVLEPVDTIDYNGNNNINT